MSRSVPNDRTPPPAPLGGARSIRLLGLSHRTAPLPVRERVALSDAEADAAVRQLVGEEGIAEALLVSTCNRTELIAVLEAGAGEAPLDAFRRDLEARAGTAIDGHIYSFASIPAVEHFFRVAASLDSLVVGEPQILGQVSDAWGRAGKLGATGPILDRLHARARQAAKRVRTETGIGEMPVSVASVAVELAEKIFGKLAGRSALVVGGGETAWLTLRHLAGAGLTRAWVTNRTDERAAELAEAVGVLPIAFERRFEALGDVDLVLSATAATEPIIRKSDLLPVMGKRRHRPIFFIDLAVPRDVEPAVADLENVFLYNIDDLAGVIETNRAARRREADQGEAIVTEEAARFLSWLDGQQLVPTIVALREHIEAIRQSEEARFLADHPQLGERDRQAVRAFASRLVGRILHDPSIRLREASDPVESARLIEAARRLFALDDGEDRPPADE